jgi:hypothetical protein
MIRFQSDHNLAGLDPAGPARSKISGRAAASRKGKNRSFRRPEIGARIALYCAVRIGLYSP